MSKVIEASCVGGVVTADSLPVADAVILSEGVGASSGVLVMDEDSSTYVAKTSPDLKTTLEKIASALGQIATALTAIDAKPAGALPPAPAAASSIAQIAVIQAEVTTLKGILK